MTTVYLDIALYEALRDLSISTGDPMTRHIRKGIEKELAAHGVQFQRKPRAKK